MEAPNVALALLGGLLLVLNRSSGIVNRRIPFLSYPLLATLYGVAIGPTGFGLVSLAPWGDPIPILEQATCLAVGLAVVGIALRLPEGYFRERAGSIAAVLGPGMLAMWLVGAALAWLLLDASSRVALLIGAIVTPTDPVLANTIATCSTTRRC